MNIEPKEYYIALQSEAREKKKTLSKKILTISVVRLLIVCVGIGATWALWGSAGWIAMIDGLCVVAFLALVKYHDRLFRRRALEEAYMAIGEDNMERMALELKDAPTGEEFIDAEHPYSYDLDLFGRGSLFSLIDTTATSGGRNLLAEHLRNPEAVSGEIAQRQEAVKELAAMNDFRTSLRALGIVATDEEDDSVSNVDIKNLPNFGLGMWTRIVTWAVPVAWIAVIAAGIAGAEVGAIVILLILASMLIAGAGAKRVGRLHGILTAVVKKVMVYESLFEEIERHDFNGAKLKAIGSRVTGECSASVVSKKLLKIVTNLDQRYNWLSYLLFNGLAQWDYRQIHAAQRWVTRYGDKLPEWEMALSQIDELCALATYSYNNPEFVFPKEDMAGLTVIEAKNMGHPLLGKDKCVCNGIEPMGAGSFMVVTGANMAGKSTYLRTVGVNYLFALIGASVFATEMKFSPRTLCTGLRTTDSLQENKSYFFAELSRLQSIIKRADKGEKLFVILDEILKGTNSVDKQKGSLGLVRQLVKKGVTGIIATHDLKLGMLAEEFPDAVANYCFEAQIGGDNLTFDYKLQAGIAQNMNATYLMRKMGIIE